MIGPRAPSMFRPTGVVGIFSAVVAFRELEYLMEDPQTYEQMLGHQWARELRRM